MSISQGFLTKQWAILPQTSKGRWNGFHLVQILAWKGNQPSLRKHQPDMFAIPAPRRRG
jgi:hypothetical protein